MNNKQPNYNREFEEISGVTNVPEIMKKRRDAFEHSLIDISTDKTLGYLVAFGNKYAARPDHGLLGGLIMNLRDFEDKFLFDQERFFDSDAQRTELEVIFATTMHKVISKWPLLAKQGYDWGNLCKALTEKMENLAGVFGLSQPMENYITDWFAKYRQSQSTKTTGQKYQEREELNQRAVRAYSELSYLSTVGADKNVIDQVRKRIAGIDKELDKLPVDPRAEAVPAFSKWNPQQKEKVIISEHAAANRGTEFTGGEEKPARKKSFWQRLKFWER